MAVFLTNERYYFHGEASTGSEGFRHEVDERMEPERVRGRGRRDLRRGNAVRPPPNLQANTWRRKPSTKSTLMIVKHSHPPRIMIPAK